MLGCPWIADFRDLWTQNLAEQKQSSLPLRIRSFSILVEGSSRPERRHRSGLNALQREMESQVLLLLGWSDPMRLDNTQGSCLNTWVRQGQFYRSAENRSVLTDVLEGSTYCSKPQLRECIGCHVS